MDFQMDLELESYDPVKHDRIVGGADRFVNHLCLRCGYHGAAFATPRFLTACPKCLAERIADVDEPDRPGWIRYLRDAALREAERQDRKEKESLTVDFDDFCKCAACGKLVPRKDARYLARPDSSVLPPHCPDCHDRLKRALEGER